MALERELEVYRAHAADFVEQNEGKYVVVCGEQIEGPYETLDAALDAGYDKFGLTPFLTKKVCRDEPIHYFSRDLR